MAAETGTTGLLSSPPQVLTAILDAAYGVPVDAGTLGETISTDAGASAGILAAARIGAGSASLGPPSVERALATLGVDSLRNVMVASALRQHFAPDDVQSYRFLTRFWRRSLVAAKLARALASLTRYSEPDQAYLTGLFLGVGQLELLRVHRSHYVALFEDDMDEGRLHDREREFFGLTHCELGAERVAEWSLGRFVADAIRFQNASTEDVQDAHHLVKIANLTRRFAAEDEPSEAGLAAATGLFGMDPDLTRGLFGRIIEDVERTARSLGIGDAGGAGEEAARDARQALGVRLEQVARIAQARLELSQVDPGETMRAAVQRVAFMMLGTENSILFLANPDGTTLSARIEGEREPAFLLAVVPGRSLVVDALLTREPRYPNPGGEGHLAVVDRQILGLLGCDAFWCLPLVYGAEALGVLVAGVRREDLQDLVQGEGFARLLGLHLGSVLARRAGLRGETEPEGEVDARERHLREVIHEASNPLSVINNYLEMLRVRLDAEHEAQNDLQLIRQEIERVGEILGRLREPPPPADNQSLALNEGVRQMMPLFEKSFFERQGTRLVLDLDPGDPRIRGRMEQLRQILGNLLKNAVEALGQDGEVRVATRDQVSVNGRSYIELSISDNGPGIPREVLARLFAPMRSSKGPGHAGLGLSIVKNLVDEVGGTIVCSSDASGTRFQLLFPRLDLEPCVGGAT
ncbi:HDOD domain-containing protein [Thioalkalivibrio paradoxus]|uniref:histidine kinase n=1 Tax=Thioalkalivibrio paradoxus ARh 1 TaxID=713585 RepID=W0DT50_9GAMM|nr:HDOD domain-containing protein [Thioalkalivibrio paradoxus]AHF00051.1 hypothetical protein THITH_07850 [Thioalkalivibrio paradoxus ARh 1]